MRIAISGAACQGKSTLINDFLATYNQYSKPEKSYRSLIDNDQHSKKTTTDLQWSILDFMAEQVTSYRNNDNIVYDRCTLDNIVYSLWCYDKGVEGFDRQFIDKCMPLVKESMKFIDIIFYLPITKVAPVDIVEDGTRETDKDYIVETDNLFKAMYQQWLQPDSSFFPHDDKPAIIEIFGSPQERMHMIKLYVDEESGDAVEEEGILNPSEMQDIESQFRNSGDGYTDVNNINRLTI